MLRHRTCGSDHHHFIKEGIKKYNNIYYITRNLVTSLRIILDKVEMMTGKCTLTDTTLQCLFPVIIFLLVRARRRRETAVRVPMKKKRAQRGDIARRPNAAQADFPISSLKGVRYFRKHRKKLSKKKKQKVRFKI